MEKNMFTKRIIPCLDCKDGRVVKGTNFVDLVDAGDPVLVASAYDKAGADEKLSSQLQLRYHKSDKWGRTRSRDFANVWMWLLYKLIHKSSLQN